MYFKSLLLLSFVNAQTPKFDCFLNLCNKSVSDIFTLPIIFAAAGGLAVLLILLSLCCVCCQRKRAASNNFRARQLQWQKENASVPKDNRLTNPAKEMVNVKLPSSDGGSLGSKPSKPNVPQNNRVNARQSVINPPIQRPKPVKVVERQPSRQSSKELGNAPKPKEQPKPKKLVDYKPKLKKKKEKEKPEIYDHRTGPAPLADSYRPPVKHEEVMYHEEVIEVEIPVALPVRNSMSSVHSFVEDGYMVPMARSGSVSFSSNVPVYAPSVIPTRPPSVVSYVEPAVIPTRPPSVVSYSGSNVYYDQGAGGYYEQPQIIPSRPSSVVSYNGEGNYYQQSQPIPARPPSLVSYNGENAYYVPSQAAPPRPGSVISYNGESSLYQPPMIVNQPVKQTMDARQDYQNSPNQKPFVPTYRDQVQANYVQPSFLASQQTYQHPPSNYRPPVYNQNQDSGFVQPSFFEQQPLYYPDRTPVRSMNEYYDYQLNYQNQSYGYNGYQQKQMVYQGTLQSNANYQSYNGPIQSNSNYQSVNGTMQSNANFHSTNGTMQSNAFYQSANGTMQSNAQYEYPTRTSSANNSRNGSDQSNRQPVNNRYSINQFQRNSTQQNR